MKCFNHPYEEAISVCKICGKAMCAKCSAYSGHNGVCPQCRKSGFEQEVARLKVDIAELKWPIIGWAFVTIAFCWTIIGAIIGGVNWYSRVQEKRQCEERIELLNKQIQYLDEQLLNRGTNAFV